MNDNVKMELIEPAERVRVNYAFLFLNEYLESMCLEKRVAKDRKAVLGGNLRDAKKRHWWRKPQINVRKKK